MMADLKDTTITGELSTKTISDLEGTPTVDVDVITSSSRYLRQCFVEVDTSEYSTGTGWAIGPTFGEMIGLKAGSTVKLSYHMPLRNNSTSWGGCYIEPQVRFDQGTWQSLGSSGYDGNVMVLTTASIATYVNDILIDPQQLEDFSIQFRFYYRSYDSTVEINGSHSINTTSGTATIMPGNNGLQHYAHILVEEYATLA